jgi:hypothetical protein
MPGVALKVGALVVLGFVCACGSEFMAGGASGGGGGDGGTNAGGGSAGSGKGGSKSGGSSSAGSSSAGSNVGGGSGACVPGGACAPEGSSCTSRECCPCVYQCSSGRWEQMGCASCAPPRCPPEPPSDGQACSECQDPVGEPCSWDLCETSLERHSATCDGSTWKLSVEACGGDGCCSGDDDCASMICVNNVCKEPIVDGCWRDHECGADAVCSGASVCSCGVECFAPDSPGVCVPADLGCCSDGAPCLDSSQRCVAGVCREAPPQGQCWSDADCPGGVCKESNVCSCGGTCTGIEYPGTCG